MAEYSGVSDGAIRTLLGTFLPTAIAMSKGIL
jgi:hypothetical protein